MQAIAKVLLLICVFGFLIGCASTPNPYIPTADDWKQSTSESARDPKTWVPLLAATAVLATNSDGHISDWASSKNPVFGSQQNAEDFSKNGKQALEVLAYSSVLLSPQMHSDLSWWEEKGKDLLVAYAAHGFADGTTGALKVATGRERPNGNNNHSFPSGHATSAAAYAAEIIFNADKFDLNPTSHFLINASVYTAAIGVAWGRVESKAHYPTDILVGLSIGNFVARTTYSAFSRAGLSDMRVMVTPTPGGAMLSVYGAF